MAEKKQWGWGQDAEIPFFAGKKREMGLGPLPAGSGRLGGLCRLGASSSGVEAQGPQGLVDQLLTGLLGHVSLLKVGW